MVDTQFTNSKRFLLDDYELEVKWKPDTKKNVVQQVIYLMKSDILKKYNIQNLTLNDINQKPISLEDAFVKNITPCFIDIGTSKDQTSKNNQPVDQNSRENRDVYFIHNEDNIELIMYKQKNQVKKTISYKLSAILKLNQQNQAKQINQPKQQPDNSSQTFLSPLQVPTSYQKVGNGKSQAEFIRLEQKQVQLQQYTKEDIAKHNQPTDAWTIFEGRVYDVTKYIKYHPGGQETIVQVAGKDCTQLVYQYHQWVNVKYLLEKFQVGVLVGSKR